jgi:hypothetical protein
MQQSTTTPRQFRHAGPMILRDSSEASLNQLRQLTTTHAKHIKYLALYKMTNGSTMVLAWAQDRLSVMQWRSLLGKGVQAIVHLDDLKGAICQAKQQAGFEEYGSPGKLHGVKPRAVVLTHVDASLEQVVHVQLLSPVKEPVHKKLKTQEQQQQEPTITKKKVTASNNDNPSKRIVEKYAKLREQYPKVSVWQPYLVARASYFKTQEEIKHHQKMIQPKPPADLSLADYHPPTSAARTSLNGKDIMQQGRLHAHEAYLKANEDYSLGRVPQRISMRSTFEKQE